MKVVLDTGFASSLYKIDELHLVKRLFGTDRAYIPVAVLTELSRCEFFKDFVSLISPDEKSVTKERWLIVLVAEPLEKENLGLGEREAISLAGKLNAVLLIDDQAAKKEAVLENVDAFDLAAFLLACKLNGEIRPREMKEIIKDLRVRDFYRFGKETLKELLS